MPSLQSLRRKIAAFKNTQKITKAMKMVAAAKLKRSQDRILAARPYAHKMRGVLSNLSQRVNRTSHPLLQKREGKSEDVDRRHQSPALPTASATEADILVADQRGRAAVKT